MNDSDAAELAIAVVDRPLASLGRTLAAEQVTGGTKVI